MGPNVGAAPTSSRYKGEILADELIRKMEALLGFEPRLSASKAGCLSVDDSAIWLHRWDSNPRLTGYEPAEDDHSSTVQYGTFCLIRTDNPPRVGRTL